MPLSVNKSLMNTNMNNDNIQLSLNSLNCIEDFIKKKQYIGNADYYNIDKIRTRFIDILKGSTGNWSREAPIGIAELGFIVVVKEDILKNINCWNRTSPSNKTGLLIYKHLYPSVYLSDRYNSIFIEFVESSYEHLNEHVFRNCNKFITKQPDNLIKIRLNDSSIDSICLIKNEQMLQPEPEL